MINNEKKNSFDNINDAGMSDVFNHISTFYLDPLSLTRASLASTTWNGFFSKNQLWKPLLEHDFNINSEFLELFGSSKQENIYKKIYCKLGLIKYSHKKQILPRLLEENFNNLFKNKTVLICCSDDVDLYLKNCPHENEHYFWLYFCVYTSGWRIPELLLQHGHVFPTVELLNYTVLAKNYEFLKILLKDNRLVFTIPDKTFDLAIGSGEIKILDLLLKFNKKFPKFTYTSLEIAAESGSVKMLEHIESIRDQQKSPLKMLSNKKIKNEKTVVLHKNLILNKKIIILYNNLELMQNFKNKFSFDTNDLNFAIKVKARDIIDFLLKSEIKPDLKTLALAASNPKLFESVLSKYLKLNHPDKLIIAIIIESNNSELLHKTLGSYPLLSATIDDTTIKKALLNGNHTILKTLIEKKPALANFSLNEAFLSGSLKMVQYAYSNFPEQHKMEFAYLLPYCHSNECLKFLKDNFKTEYTVTNLINQFIYNIVCENNLTALKYFDEDARKELREDTLKTILLRSTDYFVNDYLIGLLNAANNKPPLDNVNLINIKTENISLLKALVRYMLPHENLTLVFQTYKTDGKLSEELSQFFLDPRIKIINIEDLEYILESIKKPFENLYLSQDHFMKGITNNSKDDFQKSYKNHPYHFYCHVESIFMSDKPNPQLVNKLLAMPELQQSPLPYTQYELAKNRNNNIELYEKAKIGFELQHNEEMVKKISEILKEPSNSNLSAESNNNNNDYYYSQPK